MKVLLAFLILSGATLSAQDVVPSAKRAATIASLKSQLTREFPAYDANARNPFSMRGFEVSAAAPTEEKTSAVPETHDLLAILGDQVDTKGRFVMGGEVMLLAGGNKRLRIGSKVPVTHGGLIYELEITAIDNTRFTVRYKNETYTRPISQKPPVKNP